MMRTGEKLKRTPRSGPGIPGFGPGSRNSPLDMLNVGCGRTWHPEWTNIDLIPANPAVKPVDICQGLPFADQSYDAVYHSHLLEHLDVEQGQELIAECFRVLRPGGILRIVVPDLEQITRLYLSMHEQSWQGDTEAQEHYEWIKLELLDQLVRSRSGGRMGQYMSQMEDADAGFVRSRIGVEYTLCRGLADALQENSGGGNGSDPQHNTTAVSDNPRVSDSWRVRLARWMVRTIAGERFASRFDEAEFRARGEVHRWMYDRHSLRTLCNGQGFEAFKVCSALTSSVSGFDRFELDCRDGEVRKPDSLFVECMRPDLV